jgi:alpha-ribazole phosphatase
VRHGEVEKTALKQCYGALDVALSENGREQIRRAAEFLKSEPFDQIHTSTLSRAWESAAILRNCTIHRIPALSEMNFGDCEGLTYDEIAARYPDLYASWMAAPTAVQFPNGECFADMRLRVLNAFSAICREHEGRTIAIVAHAGVNRVLIAWALGIQDENVIRIGQDYGCVNLLTLVNGFPMVQLLNYSR